MAKDDYIEHTVIKGAGKVVVAPVTFRKRISGEKVFSFMISRIYEHSEGHGRTPWLFRRHIPEIRKLLDEVEQVLALEEERSRIVIATEKDEDE